MFNYLFLKLVSLLHILFVLFIVVTPFTNSNYYLFLHSIIVPTVILHWLLNDNTCAITLIEKELKKELYGDSYTDDSCLTCKIIDPVYDFKNNYDKFTKIIYSVVVTLWVLSLVKLYSKYRSGVIVGIDDLFKIQG